MIRDVVLLGVLVALVRGARSFLPPGATVTGSGAALAMGFVVLAALYTGRIFHRLRLPHLTGFLLCGMVLGPQVSGLLTDAMLHDLSLVKRVAVGLIVLVAGCELNVRALRPRLRRIGLLASGGMVVAWLLLFVFFWLALPMLPPTALLATSLAATAFPGFGGSDGNALVGLATHLGGSVVAGAGLGLLLSLYVSRVGRRIGLFVFALLFTVAEAGIAIHLDPLLVGLTAGLVVENASPVDGSRVVRETEPATVPVFALFFGVIGAEVHLDHFVAMAGLAVTAAMMRATGFFVGTQVGGRLAGVEPLLVRRVPFGMIPQAGVALALADLLAGSSQPWAQGLAPLVFGTIVVNELVGPVLFRAALVRAGEVGGRPADEPLPPDDTEERELASVPP